MEGRAVGPWGDELSASRQRELLPDFHGAYNVVVGWQSGRVTTPTRADQGIERDNFYSAGGEDRTAWRAAVSLVLADHTDAADSFVVGSYEE